jgi:hypothetical protein
MHSGSEEGEVRRRRVRGSGQQGRQEETEGRGRQWNRILGSFIRSKRAISPIRSMMNGVKRLGCLGLNGLVTFVPCLIFFFFRFHFFAIRK